MGVTDSERRTTHTNRAIRFAVELHPNDYKLDLMGDGGVQGVFNCALGLFTVTD